MRPGFPFQYANGSQCLDGDIAPIHYRLYFFNCPDRFQLPSTSGGRRHFQFRGEPGRKLLRMFGDEVFCQIGDVEVFEEQALGQRAEVRFQTFDDF